MHDQSTPCHRNGGSRALPAPCTPGGPNPLLSDPGAIFQGGWSIPPSTPPIAGDSPATPDPSTYDFVVPGMARSRGDAKRKALLALGTGMLSGGNFWQGLSKGAEGYAGVMADEDERRKPQVQSYKNGAVISVTDPTTGAVSFRKTPVQDYDQALAEAVTSRQLAVTGARGAIQSGIASGNNATRLQAAQITADGRDADRRQRGAEREAQRALTYQMHLETLAGMGLRGPRAQAIARRDVGMQFDAEDAARQAPSDLDTYDRIEQLAGHAGMGLGVGNKLLRGAVSATGVGMGGVDPDALSQLKTELGTLQLKAGALLKGQGAVSNAERQLLASSIPNMESSPAALQNVLNIMRSAAHRQIDTWNGFQASGEPSFSNYAGRNVPKTYGNSGVPAPNAGAAPKGAFKVISAKKL